MNKGILNRSLRLGAYPATFRIGYRPGRGEGSLARTLAAARSEVCRRVGIASGPNQPASLVSTTRVLVLLLSSAPTGTKSNLTCRHMPYHI